MEDVESMENSENTETTKRASLYSPDSDKEADTGDISETAKLPADLTEHDEDSGVLDSMSRTEVRRKRKKTIVREIKEWAGAILLAVVIAVLIRLFFFEVFLVEGSSMYPTLQNHERLIVNKATYYFNDPIKGDIVVFNYSDHRDFIKRVIAVGNDEVRIMGNHLYVNGVQLDEPYLSESHMPDFGPVIIPENHIFVLGDNRGNSMDSRDPAVGYISLQKVKGKAVLVFWPLDEGRLLKGNK